MNAIDRLEQTALKLEIEFIKSQLSIYSERKALIFDSDYPLSANEIVYKLIRRLTVLERKH